MKTPLVSLILACFAAAPLAEAQEHDLDSVQRVVDLTNTQRRANGLPELRVSGYLAYSAQSHADDQSVRNYNAHNSPEGMTPRDRMLAVGYDPNTYTAENIYNAWGDPNLTSADGAVNWWLNSPGHRANILDPKMTEIGVGIAITAASGMHIYVQNFGSAPVTGNGGWGAIAYSKKLGAAGSAKDKASAGEALAGAMQQCTNASDDCVLALSYRNGCGVIKKDASGAWGAGLAGGPRSGMSAINAAGTTARLRCVTAGGSDCNDLVVATCSGQ